MLTLDESLVNAKYFSVINASIGFWQAELDEKSSNLITLAVNTFRTFQMATNAIWDFIGFKNISF